MKKTDMFEKRIFALLYILTVPIYTLSFGLLKDPIEFTLSQIGYLMRYRVAFIVWGVVSGFLLIAYLMHIYKRAMYFSRAAKLILGLAYLFLLLTVVVPAARYTDRVLYYIHLVCAGLFVGCLIISMIMFVRYLCKNTVIAKNIPIVVMTACIVIPFSVLLVYGKLTGVAEMVFFACVTAAMIIADVKLMKLKKADVE